MNHQVTSLTVAFKTVDAFGIANAADFLPASMGGQQFALIHAAVPQMPDSILGVINLRGAVVRVMATRSSVAAVIG